MTAVSLGTYPVSALMSTYAGEIPKWLSEALESIFAQTLPPDQMVLVVDGPIGEELTAIIGQYQGDPRIPVVDVIKLPSNRGLANALNAGLEICSGDWIMRMDSDDRSHLDRLAVQMDYIRNHPTVDMLSAWCEEFSEDSTEIRIKLAPAEHDAIKAAMRWRNVITHPTNLIRAETLRNIGGYRSKFGMLEDYDLYVRLLLAGARFHVLPQSLLKRRVNRAVYKRRGGWRYLLCELQFRMFCYRSGFLNARQFLTTTAAYALFRLIGGSLRFQLYRFVRVRQA
jgi:glycosyltransferase involved in cell wall biosynthesis